MRNHDSASLPLLDNRYGHCIEDGFGIGPVRRVKDPRVPRERSTDQLLSLRETRPLGFRSSALTGVERLTLLVGKESVALAGHLSVEAKLPTMG